MALAEAKVLEAFDGLIEAEASAGFTLLLNLLPPRLSKLALLNEILLFLRLEANVGVGVG